MSNYSDFYNIVRSNWTPNEVEVLTNAARAMDAGSPTDVVNRINDYGYGGENPFDDVPENYPFSDGSD